MYIFLFRWNNFRGIDFREANHILYAQRQGRKPVIIIILILKMLDRGLNLGHHIHGANTYYRPSTLVE